MAEETITILKVGTEEAVKSVNDLKNNIKALKQGLGELEIGTQEYQDTLDELKVNQNALKDAMHATSSSMEDVAAAATGASNSYNSLVHRMAALKEEWRATNDEARRNELGVQIANINQQLKDMDASVGNFQRNVGNYESGVSGLVAKFDAWGATLKQMPPTLGAAKESIGKVGETMQLVGKQPILGIIGLLAPIIMKITTALQDNETAMGAVNKIMEAMKPVTDLLAGALEMIAQGFSTVVDKVIELVGGSGWFNKFTSTIAGVGNSVIQYLLTPVRTAIEAFKGLGNIVKDIFTGQWDKIKTDAQSAWDGIKDAFSEGFSFEQNYAEGQRVGEQFIEGIKSKKADAKAAADEIKKEMSIEEQYGISEDEGEEDYDQFAALAADEAQRAKDDAQLQAMLKGMEAREKAKQREADMEKAVADEVTAYLKEQEEQRTADAEAASKNRIATINAAASATSSLLSSIADMYEQNAEQDKKAAKKAKALRIASATIDMLQGAVTAFTSSMQLGPIAGPIVGAVNAAAVVAMGIANINKIKSTNVDSSSSSGGASASAPASVSAPTVETNLTSVRNVTSASEEDRLNRMAKDQRVYIVSSDIEAALDDNKTRVEESSF